MLSSTRRGCLLAIALLLPAPACSKDDACATGSAMVNPRFVGKPQAVAGGAQQRLAWDTGTERGAQLPRAYFAAAKVSPDRDVGPDGPPIDEAVTLTADREIVVMLRTNIDTLRGTVRFTLELPDRATYITCTKGSSPERYGLRVEATFDSNGVKEATFTEIRPSDD